MRTHLSLALSVAILTACSGGSSTPPPPTAATPPPPTTVATPPAPPPGQVYVTVAAASQPPGATVTGGGQMLGTTPFTTQVPVPVAAAGETQTFQFTFVAPGFQPATLTASPVNNTISLNAVLTPVLATAVPPPPTTMVPGGRPGVIPVHGGGGGPIFDYHTTTAQAMVPQQCPIRSLRVVIDGRHTFNRDLEVSLRAPDGTSFSLQRHSSRSPFRSHTVSRARGHMSAGTWTLSISDTVGADSGTLSGFDMVVECM